MDRYGKWQNRGKRGEGRKQTERGKCWRRGKGREERGETLIETLVALLVAVLGLTMLAGAIVSSARVNSQTKNISVMRGASDGTGTAGGTTGGATGIPDESVSITAAVTGDGSEVTFRSGSGSVGSESVPISGHRQENGGLYYYDVG